MCMGRTRLLKEKVPSAEVRLFCRNPADDDSDRIAACACAGEF